MSSPSSTSFRRSTPCVDGCCGPMFSTMSVLSAAPPIPTMVSVVGVMGSVSPTYAGPMETGSPHERRTTGTSADTPTGTHADTDTHTDTDTDTAVHADPHADTAARAAHDPAADAAAGAVAETTTVTAGTAGTTATADPAGTAARGDEPATGVAEAEPVWTGLPPGLLRVRRLLLVVWLGLLTLATGLVPGILAGPGWAAFAVLPLALMIWGWVMLERNWRSWRYAERSDDLLISRGVLWRQETVVPYGRMQLVEVTS